MGNSSDLFDLFMKNSSHSQKKKIKKTKSILHILKISLEEAYTGKNKYFEITRYRLCKSCLGSGSKSPNLITTCSGCKGKGFKLIVTKISMGVMQQNVTCPDCNGEGREIKDKNKCIGCKGNKCIQERKNIQIYIDKGVPDGHRYVIKGESDELPDTIPGDLIVEIQIEQNQLFLRKGADLIFKMEVNLVEALVGFEKVIEFIDKRKIKIKTKKGDIVKPDQYKTVTELGMPFFQNPCRYGNLFILFKIKFPEKVENEKIKILSKIFPILKMEKKNYDSNEIYESYFLTDFNPEDENTNCEGGKLVDNNNDQEYSGFDEDDNGGRNMNCASQ